MKAVFWCLSAVRTRTIKTDIRIAIHLQLAPEYKKLGALVSKDPKLAGRVIVAKV